MPAKRTSPDVFILGAPKCGTTALAHYLSEHPEICVSRPKEPNFFCADLDVSRIDADSVDAYEASCFAHADPKVHRALIDASVWNLYSEQAVPRILSAYPDTRFVVMLRNPVDMAHSLHSQSVFQGQEDQQSFIAAWRLCEERRRGRSLPRRHGRILPEILYDEVCSLGEQVERLLRSVPKERVRFVLADDMKRDTLATYNEVLRFLGVSPEPRREFPAVNEARRFNSALVAYALRSRLAHRTAIFIKKVTGLKTLGIGKPMPPLSEDARREVGAFFADDIRKLAELTGRNLDHWLERNALREERRAA